MSEVRQKVWQELCGDDRADWVKRGKIDAVSAENAKISLSSND